MLEGALFHSLPYKSLFRGCRLRSAIALGLPAKVTEWGRCLVNPAVPCSMDQLGLLLHHSVRKFCPDWYGRTTDAVQPVFSRFWMLKDILLLMLSDRQINGIESKREYRDANGWILVSLS